MANTDGVQPKPLTQPVKIEIMKETYNCDMCNCDVEYDPNQMTDFAGMPCTVKAYHNLTSDNPNVVKVCKKCLDELPDASRFFESGDIIKVPNENKLN